MTVGLGVLSGEVLGTMFNGSGLSSPLSSSSSDKMVPLKVCFNGGGRRLVVLVGFGVIVITLLDLPRVDLAGVREERRVLMGDRRVLDGSEVRRVRVGAMLRGREGKVVRGLWSGGHGHWQTPRRRSASVFHVERSGR